MADADGDREPIYVFALDRAYLFKHYFAREDVFDALSDHYDHDEYRFEVPEREWDDVAETLRGYRYAPEVVEDLADFVVVTDQYAPHADVLRESVASWTRRGHRFFLLKDPVSVELAVAEHGATPVGETDMVVGL
jgi:hypothetical protein